MTTTLPAILDFENVQLKLIGRDGRIWLTADDLARALGYAETKLVNPSEQSGIPVLKLYSRHADEFADDETRLLTVQTSGGPQELRVFSLRGARLLAMFARTAKAKAFRCWVLDLLDNLDEIRVSAPDVYTLIVRAKDIDEAMAPADLLETLCEHLAAAALPPTASSKEVLKAKRRWREHIPTAYTLLRALNVPMQTLAKLHEASRVASVGFEPPGFLVGRAWKP